MRTLVLHLSLFAIYLAPTSGYSQSNAVSSNAVSSNAVSSNAVSSNTVSEAKRESNPRIGAVLALSGPAQTWGKFSRLGIEMAIGEVNEQGGINGKKIELLLEDSQSSGRGAVTAFKKLSEFHGVGIIIGDVWVQFTQAMIPLTNFHKVVLLSPTAVAAAIESPTEYFFTMGAKTELAKDAVNKFFEIHSNIKTVALFCFDNPWGKSYTTLWEQACKEHNVEIIYRSCNPSDFGYDYRTDVAKAVHLSPDAFIIAYHTERIIRHLEELKFNRPILSTSHMVEVLANELLPQNLAEGVYYTDWAPSSDFEERFEKRYGEKPMLETHNAYEVTRAVIRGLNQKQSNFLEYLRTVSYEGVAGTIDFSKSFSVNYAHASLMVIQNGKVTRAER